MKINKKLIHLISSAMMAALTCIATMIIQIPSPTKGYTNLGDVFVLLSGWLLGPIYGGLASGIGSMLADIFSGYAHYALPTFLIKGLMGIITGLTATKIISRLDKKPGLKNIFLITSGIIAEIIMCSGYFLCEWFFKGSAAIALTGVPGNLIQGIIGIIIASSLILIIKKIKIIP